ncbi:MAG: hypothetical protein DLM62_07825 [Pseudonocardiales bacterium]|nr:MAG: hypothetical protein DLM62_07825 [Pseudonocardiales bacterium]
MPLPKLVADAAAGFADRGELLKYGRPQHVVIVPSALIDSAKPVGNPVDRLHDFREVEQVVTRHTQVLVLSCDGKGIVMRADALRPATAKAAATTTPVGSATRIAPGSANRSIAYSG